MPDPPIDFVQSWAMLRKIGILCSLLAVGNCNENCVSGECAVKEDASFIQHRQPYPQVPQGGEPVTSMSISNPVPSGSQMGRILLNTALNPNSSCPDGMIPVGTCPPEPTNHMSWPSDGQGAGPMIFEKSIAALPDPPFVGCAECASCEDKLYWLNNTISQFADISQANPGCQAPVSEVTGGTSSAFGALQPETLVWSILGYGATNHGCFGHTFVNLTELNNPCYSFGARIQAGVPYFRPYPEDILIDSCGQTAAIRLFCPNCYPRQLCPTCRPMLAKEYPQRYTWVLQLEDNAKAQYGFYITKLNAVLDTELTMDTSVQDYDFDPLVCQVLKPLSYYPPISPRAYRVELPQEPFAKARVCPHCPARMKKLVDVWNKFAEGDYKPFQDLLHPTDFVWIVAGAGPTKGGCMTRNYTTPLGYFQKPLGYWARILAMSQGKPKLLAQNVISAQGGDRSNIYYAWSIKGKGNFIYTLTGSWTIYYRDTQSSTQQESSDDFKIYKILQNFDTEVTMNMVVRERDHDLIKCKLTPPGGYADVISHTYLQPLLMGRQRIR